VRNPRGYVVRGVFEDAYNYMKSGHLLRQVINKLNAIDFNRQAERHQFNDLYEKILRDLQSAGNAGEFYTPARVTQFMVDMVNPSWAKRCWTRPPAPAASWSAPSSTCASRCKRRARSRAAKQHRGVEKKQLPHMLCVTNLLLHGIEVPSHPPRQHPGPPAARLHRRRPRGRGLTNPPFGGMEEPGIEPTSPPTCAPRKRPTCSWCSSSTSSRTTAAPPLVLPDGTLFGEGVKTRIKEQLLAECNLHTIVRLPNGVFAPYTGIKTNLLFFTKGQPTSTSGTTSTPTRRA
jgi:type I restriction enzyme M protein